MDLTQQIKEEMRKNYINDSRVQVVLFSGGKDSSFLLTLLWEVLLELPKELRTKTIYVMSSNTGVEAPIMEEYLIATLDKIEQSARNQDLPIVVIRAEPSYKDNFWYRTLGGGI